MLNQQPHHVHVACPGGKVQRAVTQHVRQIDVRTQPDQARALDGTVRSVAGGVMFEENGLCEIGRATIGESRIGVKGDTVRRGKSPLVFDDVGSTREATRCPLRRCWSAARAESR